VPRAVVAAPSQAGQGLVEYSLILSLSGLLALVLLVFFGGALSDILLAISDAIESAT
jgi:hypothetical protein